MTLHVLNEGATAYGFPLEITDKNPSFHGHARGILFAEMNDKHEVIHNHMPACDDPDDALKRLMDDHGVYKLEHDFYNNDPDGTIKHTIGYYIPYYVVGHSAYEPTSNFARIASMQDGKDRVNYVTMELLFVHQGYNRYATITIKTKDVPIMETLHEAFKEENSPVKGLEMFGVRYNPNETINRYVLDFYDDIGDVGYVGFERSESLYACLVSARVLKVLWKYQEDDMNDNDNSTE